MAKHWMDIFFSPTQSLQGSSGNFEGIFYQMGLWFSEDFTWTNIKEHPPSCLPEKVRKGNNGVEYWGVWYSGIQKLLHILFLGPLAQNWSLLKTPEEVWKMLPCLERKHSFFLIIFCNLAEISSFQNIVVINNGHLSLKILLVLRFRW